MKTFTNLVVMIVALASAGCASMERLFESDTKLTLDGIPAEVKAAAEQAVPGLVIAEAEVETKDGTVVYELEGTVDGKECELKIRADGTVLRIKRDDAED